MDQAQQFSDRLRLFKKRVDQGGIETLSWITWWLSFWNPLGFWSLQKVTMFEMLRQIENHADSSRRISWRLGKHEWFQMASKYIEWHPILLAMRSCSACPHMVLYWRLGQGVIFLFGAISFLVALEGMIIFIYFHCLHSSPYVWASMILLGWCVKFRNMCTCNTCNSGRFASSGFI